MESCGGPPALLGLLPLLMVLHRGSHLKGTGKTPCSFTGSGFNMSFTASVEGMHRVTSEALGLLKTKVVELSANTAEKKKQYQDKAFYRLHQALVLAEVGEC